MEILSKELPQKLPGREKEINQSNCQNLTNCHKKKSGDPVKLWYYNQFLNNQYVENKKTIQIKSKMTYDPSTWIS